MELLFRIRDSAHFSSRRNSSFFTRQFRREIFYVPMLGIVLENKSARTVGGKKERGQIERTRAFENAWTVKKQNAFWIFDRRREIATIRDVEIWFDAFKMSHWRGKGLFSAFSFLERIKEKCQLGLIGQRAQKKWSDEIIRIHRQSVVESAFVR